MGKDSVESFDFHQGDSLAPKYMVLVATHLIRVELLAKGAT